MIWVSPTEPAQLRAIADRVSMYPEDFGVDVLIAGKGNMLGVQRKAIPDFLASVEDGRLTEQIVKMGRLDHSMVLIEGHVDWVNDVLLTNGWGKSVSRDSWRRMMLTVRAAGVHVEYSRDVTDTISWVRAADAWCAVEKHSTLEVKGNRVVGKWGERTRDHYRVALLASLPGMGAELAQRVLDQVGWPLRLVEDLSQVKGLGAKKIAKIKEVLGE